MGFLSQSGALGLAVMGQAATLGLGLSTFVSVGNKADISGNDLLCYWEQDERTDLLLLYLESFGNPRRFGRLARRIGRTKPIVAVKSGRSVAGRRAASSHTGALLAASDTTVDALFRQHGVIRTDTLEEMFDVATLLANQPVPSGNRVAIVTNAGGLGILCADTCEANDLSVPELAPETVATLASFLPHEASVSNPVDMIASASAERLRARDRDGRRRPRHRRDDRDLHPAARGQRPRGRPRRWSRRSRRSSDRIPVLTCFMSSRGLPDALRAPGVRIPSFAYPEQAAIALAHATAARGVASQARGHRAARSRCGRTRPPPSSPARSPEARGGSHPTRCAPCSIATACRRRGRRGPRAPTTLPAWPSELGGPVALKAIGPVHKTEVGAVDLGVDAGRRGEGRRRDARAGPRGGRAGGRLPRAADGRAAASRCSSAP